MDVWRYAEHGYVPIEGIDKALNHIACPFFSHTGVGRQHLDGLEDRYTFVDLGFIVGKIQRITHSLFIGIEKNLSFLLEIGNKLIEQSLELNTVDDYIHSVGLYDISQSLLCILESELILLFLLKLGAAERASYNKAGTCICFPFTAALFTLHYISPPFVEL